MRSHSNYCRNEVSFLNMSLALPIQTPQCAMQPEYRSEKCNAYVTKGDVLPPPAFHSSVLKTLGECQSTSRERRSSLQRGRKSAHKCQGLPWGAAWSGKLARAGCPVHPGMGTAQSRQSCPRRVRIHARERAKPMSGCWSYTRSDQITIQG